MKAHDHSSDYILTSILAQITQILLSSTHEVSTTKFLTTYAATAATVLIYLLKSEVHCSAFCATKRFFVLNGIFITVLVVSTGIRRLFFHPLRRFPGKRIAALTKIYEAYLNGHGRNALVIRDLHAQHGDFVRTGPGELSVNNVEGIPLLFGRQPYKTRGPFYEVGATVDTPNVLTERDNKTHQKWRRIWDAAFSRQALAQYQPRVESHVSKLVSILEGLEGRETDAVKIFSNMAFDIMADLGFGTEYGMQDGAGDPSYMDFIHDHMNISVIIGSLRNLCQLVPFLPKDAQTKAFKVNGTKLLERRITLGKSPLDVFTYFLDKDQETGFRFTKSQLYSNAQLVVVAGSDTTTSVVSNLFRELALNRSIQQKLQSEIDSLENPEGSLPTPSTLVGLPYLNAVINESLRLWPAVPSGAQAITGPTGITVAGTYIPPLTAVRIPHLTLMRDERYFPQGSSFIPERWNGERPELVKDRSAFIPFSYGPHNCVGKQLALAELRLVVASVLGNFDVSFGESYNDEQYLAGWRDYYTVKLGGLKLKFTKRTSTSTQG